MVALDTRGTALDRLFDALGHPARRRILERCRHVDDGDAGFPPVAVTTDDAPK